PPCPAARWRGAIAVRAGPGRARRRPGSAPPTAAARRSPAAAAAPGTPGPTARRRPRRWPRPRPGPGACADGGRVATSRIGRGRPRPATRRVRGGSAGPGVAQGHAAVEHRRVGAVVVAVGDEVAGALELERLLRRSPG